jgi:DNA-binding MarR family transcriptional regulator
MIGRTGYTFIMKSLHKEINEAIPGLECAALLMDVVPLVMQRIRMEMRSHRMPGLSVPQFRSLIYLYRNDGASLSQVADHIGLKLPTASKMVDALVARGLLIRRVLPDDRRCISLKLSAHGLAKLGRTRRIAEAHLAEALEVLSPAQQAKIIEALQVLRPAFATERVVAAEGGR